MILNIKILIIFTIVFKYSKSSKVLSSFFPSEASVAVLDCSKKYPNVYFDLARKEWVVHGAESKCFSSEKDLLELCKIVYPKFNVANVMKSDEQIKFTIYGCTNGDVASSQLNNVLTLEENEKLKNCSKLRTKSVYPYKCLYGDFKSSELFIPPKCQFQHLFSNDVCQSQDHWNLLSIEKCKSSNSVLNTSMLLQWCDAASSGISTFSGIEFVCCPEKTLQENQPGQQLASQQILNYIEDEDIDDDNTVYDENDDDASDNADDYNSITTGDTRNIVDLSENVINIDNINQIFNKFDQYNREKNEIEAVEGTQEQKKQYEKQKQLIISSIQASLNNLAKEKDNIKTEKESDNLYDIRLNRLRIEKDRLLLQEETVYEQQVQGRLNEIKLNSVRDLNKIMQEQTDIKKQNLEVFVKSLYNFLIAQENDRLHMVTVYKKLKAYFSDELVERAQSIINHLELIDRTINQTISVFIKKFQDKGAIIVNATLTQLKQYYSIRKDANKIIIELKNIKKNTQKLETTKSGGKYIKTDLTENSDDVILNYEDDNYDKYKQDDYETESSDNIDKDDSDEKESSETNDSDSEQNDNKQDEFTNNAIDIKLIKSDSNGSFLIIGISLGILLSLILIFSVIKRKRLQARQSIKHGFLPVETSNPEDKHLNNMQLNGYENPTYKFFENNLQV